MASSVAYGQYGSQNQRAPAVARAPPPYALNMTWSAPEKDRFLQGERRRMNVVPILLSLFVPWALFGIVFGVLSTWVHAEQPSLTYFIVGCCLLSVLVTGFVAYGSKTTETARRDPSWLMFLFITMFIAWVAGVLLGDLNFNLVEAPKHGVKSLNAYDNINPAIVHGEQMLDAGVIRFARDSRLDVQKSMGFKSRETYCVTPITWGNGTLTSYDFWAIGINCCSGGVFHCDGANSNSARTGMRLMSDKTRAFYRLAVQQAEAAYHIKASYPLFFHWVEEEAVDVTHLERGTNRNVAIGVMSYFLFQTFCVVAASMIFSTK